MSAAWRGALESIRLSTARSSRMEDVSVGEKWEVLWGEKGSWM